MEPHGELVKLARQKPRYGYRRLHAQLSRRGQEVNVKRVYKLYVEEKWMAQASGARTRHTEHNSWLSLL